MSDNRHLPDMVRSTTTDAASIGESPLDGQRRPDLVHSYAFTHDHARHVYRHPENLHLPFSCPPRFHPATRRSTVPEPRYLNYGYPSPIHSSNHRRDRLTTSHANEIHENWQSQVQPYFDPYSHRQDNLGTGVFASSPGDDRFAGTTPPQTGEDDEYPRSFDSDCLKISPLPHQPFNEYKPDDSALNPNEGFESPDSNQVYGKSAGEPPDHFYDESKRTSVPQSIYLKSENTFTPSPEAVPCHESPVEAFYCARLNEPPPLPTFQSADTTKSDFGNSSSNSSSHTESGGETGWMKHYNSLVQYWKKNGDCNVPQKYQDIANNLNLGTWVNKQRMERRKLAKNKTSSLSQGRLAKLNALGFNWGKEKGQASWDDKYREICSFKRKHGHCMVKTKDKENPALGRWVTSQRADYKNDRLSQEKIDKLNAIGFCWEFFKKEQNEEHRAHAL